MGEPLPICFLNDEFLPLRDARISPLDRGFLYSDGAYEVTPVYGGRPFRFAQHHARLTRSLKEIRMEDPLSPEAWRAMYRELIARNDAGSSDSYIYVQVTRGAEHGRNHAPLPDVPRTVFAFAAPWPTGRAGWQENGLPAVTADDTRWARCDIKSVSLLANVLLRQLAVDHDATETILIRDGLLTDASASSVHAVIGGVLCTPPNSWKLLPGTTRGVIEEIAERAGVVWRSAPVSEPDLRSADRDPVGRGDSRDSARDHARWQTGRRRQTRPRVAQALRRVPGLQARGRGDAVVDEIKPAEELLKFPVAYPIKVVGRRSEGLRAAIDAIVREHVPDLTDDQITERASNQQHFIAITYTINAQSKEQVVALANALKANKDVIMLI